MKTNRNVLKAMLMNHLDDMDRDDPDSADKSRAPAAD